MGQAEIKPYRAIAGWRIGKMSLSLTMLMFVLNTYQLLSQNLPVDTFAVTFMHHTVAECT